MREHIVGAFLMLCEQFKQAFAELNQVRTGILSINVLATAAVGNGAIITGTAAPRIRCTQRLVSFKSDGFSKLISLVGDRNAIIGAD